MLPYFEYTEDVQSFCQLVGFTIEDSASLNRYVCTCSLKYQPTPHITLYNLDLNTSPLIPPDKVIDYLTLILNGYSYRRAVNELNVVG